MPRPNASKISFICSILVSFCKYVLLNFLAKRKTITETITDIKRYSFELKNAGGEKLKITSLVSPPPRVVIIERSITPKRSSKPPFPAA